MNYVFVIILIIFYSIRLILEPFVLIKFCIKPGGSSFVAYNYDTEYDFVNGKLVTRFKGDFHPHFFCKDEEAASPLKYYVPDKKTNIIYTHYTKKHFLFDQENHILYIKDTDMASLGELRLPSLLSEYIYLKHRRDYINEASDFLASNNSL